MNNVLDQFDVIIKNDKLSHLYLLTNVIGESHTDDIFAIATKILTANNDSADLIKHQIQLGNYPNLYVIRKDNQTIKKEQVVALQNEFSKTSLFDGNRVFIVFDAETMSVQSANSLLKFLEEPQSKNTYGLLVTQSIDKIIPTIKSRSQIISFTTNKIFKQALLDENICEKTVFCLGFLTDNPDVAKQLLTDEALVESINIINMFIDSMYDKDDLELLMYSKKYLLISNRSSFLMFLDALLSIFFDVVRLNNGVALTLPFYDKTIYKLKEKLSTEQILDKVNIIQETIKMSGGFANLDMQYEFLVTNLLGGSK